MGYEIQNMEELNNNIESTIQYVSQEELKLKLDVLNNPEKYKGINERDTILAPMVYWKGDTDDPIVIPECDKIFVHEKREKVKPYTTQQCKDKTRMECLMERLKQYK